MREMGKEERTHSRGSGGNWRASLPLPRRPCLPVDRRETCAEVWRKTEGSWSYLPGCCRNLQGREERRGFTPDWGEGEKEPLGRSAVSSVAIWISLCTCGRCVVSEAVGGVGAREGGEELGGWAPCGGAVDVGEGSPEPCRRWRRRRPRNPSGRVAAERWRPGAANPARGKIQRSEASSGRCCGVAGVAGERRNRPAPVAAEMCPGRERGLWEREVEGWGGAWGGSEADGREEAAGVSCGRDEAVCGSRRRRCGREGMDRGGWDEEWVGVGDGSRLLMAHPLVVRH